MKVAEPVGLRGLRRDLLLEHVLPQHDLADRLGQGRRVGRAPVRRALGQPAAEVALRQADDALAVAQRHVPAVEQLRVHERAHERRADAGHPAHEHALLDGARDVEGRRGVHARLVHERRGDALAAPGAHGPARLAADERQRRLAVVAVHLDDDALARRTAPLALRRVRPRRGGVARVDEHLLDRRRDVGHRRDPAARAALEIEHDDARQLLGEEAVVGAGGSGRAVDRVGDAPEVERDDAAVPGAELRDAAHGRAEDDRGRGRSRGPGPPGLAYRNGSPAAGPGTASPRRARAHAFGRSRRGPASPSAGFAPGLGSFGSGRASPPLPPSTMGRSSSRNSWTVLNSR